MRAVVTRVRSASVEIGGKVNGAIGQGYLVLLGVGPNDTEDSRVTRPQSAEAICCFSCADRREVHIPITLLQ